LTRSTQEADRAIAIPKFERVGLVKRFIIVRPRYFEHGTIFCGSDVGNIRELEGWIQLNAPSFREIKRYLSFGSKIDL
jgi:hypothetical protein